MSDKYRCDLTLRSNLSHATGALLAIPTYSVHKLQKLVHVIKLYTKKWHLHYYYLVLQSIFKLRTKWHNSRAPWLSIRIGKNQLYTACIIGKSAKNPTGIFGCSDLFTCFYTTAEYQLKSNLPCSATGLHHSCFSYHN